MKKKIRTGKVFVDWSQNDEHKTTVAVYSLRAREHPTVSTPVTWEEVEHTLKKKNAGLLVFEAPQTVKRVEKMGDLFAPVLTLKQRLPDLKKFDSKLKALRRKSQSRLLHRRKKSRNLPDLAGRKGRLKELRGGHSAQGGAQGIIASRQVPLYLESFLHFAFAFWIFYFEHFLPRLMPQLFAGTSGWAYPSWKPGFYPAKLAQKKFLSHYVTQLNTVEVNFTFRQLVKETTIQNWIQEAPAHFRFGVKAHQVITHIKRLKGTEDFVPRFLATIEPLASAGKLGPVLFQLPPNLKADAALLKDFLALLPRTLRAAFEFRHESWLRSLLGNC